METTSTPVAGEKENGDADFWVFGYGSLIFKPLPHFDLQLPGYIKSFKRRFWQSSEDHRGTPENPGRVVTLVEHRVWEEIKRGNDVESSENVWGVAFRIEKKRVEEVKEYLGIREVNGYSIEYVDFHPRQKREQMLHEEQKPVIKCLVYVGLPTNPNFVGPEDPQALAEHIFRSEGPSGTNKEYLLKLDEALDALGPESRDEHVRDLAQRVRKLEAAGIANPGKGFNSIDDSGTA